MLNFEKIRLMTRITMYEKQHEDDIVLSHYYREDYVRYGCIRTIIVATITYWSIVAMYILYKFQDIIRDINTMDYFSVIGKLMFGYLGFCAIMYIFGFVVYHIRFQLAKKGLIEYNRNLKKYLKYLDREEALEQLQTGTIKVRTEIGGGDSVEIPLRDERRRNSRS